MNIAIIGAGFAGLACAKTLREFGFDVAVHDTAPDVGGVWSRTRRYPGLTHPERQGHVRVLGPPDAGVLSRSGRAASRCRQYLETLRRALRTWHRCCAWGPRSPGRPRGRAAAGRSPRDHRRRAVPRRRSTTWSWPTGSSPTPSVPGLPGRRRVRGRRWRVLRGRRAPRAGGRRGTGTSSSSATASRPATWPSRSATVAASTTVVARELLWKMPRRTRRRRQLQVPDAHPDGRGAVPVHAAGHGLEKFLHGPGVVAGRRSMLGSVRVGRPPGSSACRSWTWCRDGSFTDIARSTVSLATEGFFERGARRVRSRVAARHGGRAAAGRGRDDQPPCSPPATTVPADVVVCGTGFRQRGAVPADRRARPGSPTTAANFVLYRQILPIGVPDLTFAGYNSSFFSPLSRRDGRGLDRCLPRGRPDQLPPASEQRRRSPSGWRGWRNAPRAGTPAARTSSRSRCTTSTRCSTTSGCDIGPRTRAGSGCCRSTPVLPHDRRPGPAATGGGVRAARGRSPGRRSAHCPGCLTDGLPERLAA